MLRRTRALVHIQERWVWPLSIVSPNSLSDTTVILITPLKRSHQSSLALQTIFSPMVLPNLKTKMNLTNRIEMSNFTAIWI